MRSTAMRIAKGSCRAGRCGYCGQPATWATLAAAGARSILLVDRPIVLRTETNDRDVSVEVLGWDQVHRCPDKKQAAARGHRPAKSAAHVSSSHERADHAFASFTPERLAELKQQLEKPRPRERGLF